MQAVYYEKQGAAKEVLKLADLGDIAPKAGEVRVQLKASAVNPSDVKTRSGLRGPMAFERIIPHSDGSGVIDAVGDGVNSSRVGESVWIYNGAFGRSDGVAAQMVCVPEALAVPFDESRLSYLAAATLGIAGQTAMAAVLKGGDLKGKNVLVTGGAGAVGYYAVQFAKYFGAKVVTTVSSDVKAEHLRKAMPDKIVNYKDADAIEQVKAFAGDLGIHHIVDLEFGGNLAMTEAVIASHGSIAAYGSEAVKEPVLPFYNLMFKNISLHWLFVYLLSAEDRLSVLAGLQDFLSNESLSCPVAGEFSLSDCYLAHELVESGKKMGHVLVVV